MSLSSIQLDAFAALAQHRGFSRAAEFLHITQSALSQRIINLEHTVGTTLVIREPTGIRLTDVGCELLRYIKKKEALEHEFRSYAGQTHKQGKKTLAGHIRLGAFSSVMHSVLYPALNSILSQNPDVTLDASIKEIRELQQLLQQGAVDFIVTSSEWSKKGIKGYKLGEEEYILISPKNNAGRTDIFLDHDLEDSMTEQFLRKNGESTKNLRRFFVDDINGILEGVALGWGSAVVPRHLICNNPSLLENLRIPRGLNAFKSPVWLYHYDQPFYTRLEETVIDVLVSKIAPVLKAR